MHSTAVVWLAPLAPNDLSVCLLCKQAADAVSAVLDGLSVALANSLQPGEEVTIESDSLTLVVERRTITPPADEAGSGEHAAAAALALGALVAMEEDEGSGDANATRPVLSTPKALFVPVDDALKSDLAKFAAASSVPVFLVPPTIEGLQGQVVDVQLVSYKASSRSNWPCSPLELLCTYAARAEIHPAQCGMLAHAYCSMAFQSTSPGLALDAIPCMLSKTSILICCPCTVVLRAD